MKKLISKKKMIKIQILSAENLPVPTKKERKTRIFCFSQSSCRYFYASYKNDENSRCPQWNVSLDIDLFRCNTIIFKLFSTQILAVDIFLGEVIIDIPTFLSQSPGKQLLSDPGKVIPFEFPIAYSNSKDTKLNLAFSISPKVYRPIQSKEISNPLIHLWANFSPSTSNQSDTVKFELIQVFFTKERKTKNGYFVHFNNSHPWESIGYTSSSKEIYDPTGNTPIATFLADRITANYFFFILDVSNFSGFVTLNFVAEQNGNQFKFSNGEYIIPKKFHPLIGTLKTVNVEVEPNTKYLVPIYFYFEKKIISNKIEFNPFPLLSRDKSLMSETKTYSERVSSEIAFHKSIVELACSAIDEFKNVNFNKIFLLPNSVCVSLQRTFRDFNLIDDSSVRIYINGLTSYSDGGNFYENFWIPLFSVIDRQTKKKCRENKIDLNYKKMFQKEVFGNDWHTYCDLKLNEIGTEKMIVFSIKCDSSLESSCPQGMIFISHVDGENETLLFRNPIFADSCDSHYATFFRFEFLEDGWNIIPMRNYFQNQKDFDSFIDVASKNDWKIPESVLEKKRESSLSESFSDEMMLDSINEF